MTKTKQDYERPITKVLELRFSGMICASGQMGINNWEDNGTDFPDQF